jgi:uncharacterized membrane protein YfcA
VLFYLFLLGLFSWLFSTLGGGGGAMVFVPASGLLLPIEIIAPVVAIAGFISSISRIALYRKSINLKVTMLVLPGVAVGAIGGSSLFSYVSPALLSIILASFYMINGLWSLCNKEKKLFKVKSWHFSAGGFISSFMSGIVGVGGPFMNPLYLNYGMKKEIMLGTKAATLMIMQFLKTITYATSGTVTVEILFLGITTGTGAIVGNLIGRKFIRRISDRDFEIIVNLMMIACALLVAYKTLSQ